MSIIKGTNQIVAGFGGTKRSIGEVYFSQSSLATDNPGALPGWTGEYYENGKTLFPDLYKFVKAHSELQITKAQYDNAIATYGECPKYVVDENIAQTSLRLPKYQKSGRYLVKKEVNGNDWYNLYSDGWLEQGGYFANPQTIGNGAITKTFWKPYATPPTVLFGNMSTRNQAAYDSEHYPYDVTATGFTHKNIQPEGQGTRWYAFSYAADTPIENVMYPWISAYTSAIPASMAQAAEFQQALTGKADTNLGNLSTAGKYLASGLGMPSSRYIDLTLGASGSTYTAPANGWFFVRKVSTGVQVIYFTNTTNGMTLSCYSSNSGEYLDSIIPVVKGQSVICEYSTGGTTQFFRFIYAEGAE